MIWWIFYIAFPRFCKFNDGLVCTVRQKYDDLTWIIIVIIINDNNKENNPL